MRGRDPKIVSHGLFRRNVASEGFARPTSSRCRTRRDRDRERLKRISRARVCVSEGSEAKEERACLSCIVPPPARAAASKAATPPPPPRPSAALLLLPLAAPLLRLIIALIYARQPSLPPSLPLTRKQLQPRPLDPLPGSRPTADARENPRRIEFRRRSAHEMRLRVQPRPEKRVRPADYF